MKLHYRILWFDDNREFYESHDFEAFDNEIASWGFIPDREFVDSPDKFRALTPYSDFDLLVVDYNLGSEKGDAFIAAVRDQDVLTEIVFYSSSPTSELWQQVSEKQLEGVYVSDRNGVLPRILKVGQHSVRKVLDLEHSRGIVMAGVGDLDHLLDELIHAVFVDLDEKQQQKLFAEFHEAVREHHEQGSAELAAFKAKPTIEGLLELCDSAKRWNHWGRMAKVHASFKAKPKFGDFSSDVLGPRNFLAHGKPERQGDGSFVLTHGRKKPKKYLFNADEGSKLRRRIIQYRQQFIDALTFVRIGTKKS